MKTALAVLLLCSCCFAQTKPIKSKALLKCEANLATANELQSQYEWAGNYLLQEKAALTAERTKLTTENEDLATRNLELAKKLEEMKRAAVEVLKFNSQLQAEYFKILSSHNALIEQYNSTLQTASNAVDQANARMARQQRFNNVLAMYAMMPKYTPPPLTIYQPQFSTPQFSQRLNVTCSSQRIGDFTYTSCN